MVNKQKEAALFICVTSLTLRPREAGGYRNLGGVERLSALTNLTELNWGGVAGKLASISALSKLEHLNLRGAKVKSLDELTALTV